jgi:UDP-3-O-[3-hydroxymyristoyl] glucosamine N-acyltransferase
MRVTLGQVAGWINGSVDGDESIEITGLAKIEEAESSQLTFIANPKYARYMSTTRAAAVLVDFEFPPADTPLIRVANPYFAFLTLVKRFHVEEHAIESGVHSTAIVGENVSFGSNVAVGPHVVIGRDCMIGSGVILHPGVVIGDRVRIGDRTQIHANVCIWDGCRIGNNVIIHMGAVIGSDGFGFVFQDGAYHKLPQMGIVTIEDDVEIGANTTIDRATLGETKIKRGTKIDNLVMVAHNVLIDEHTAIAAQAGISGSTKIGKYVKIGGQAGFVGHIHIGDNAIIGAQAGVTKVVEDGAFVSGYPAREHMKAKREEASLARLPDVIKKVRRLEKKIAELTAKEGQAK